MKYCTLCERNVDPVKSKFSWPVFILLCFTMVGGLVYVIFHLFFKKKNRCPICFTKKLDKMSPAQKEAKFIEKEEKKEKRKETIANIADKVKETIN